MDSAEWDRFCGGLNKLGQIAADRGFKLCFRHHMGTVFQTSEETDRMISSTDPEAVFLCYDTGHFTFAEEDPLAMLRKYMDRVGHVHLKAMRLLVVEEDRKNNWSFLQSVRNSAFTVPGDGGVDFDPVFKVCRGNFGCFFALHYLRKSECDGLSDFRGGPRHRRKQAYFDLNRQKKPPESFLYSLAVSFPTGLSVG